MTDELPVPDDSLYELHRFAAMWDTEQPNDDGRAVQLVAAPVVVRVLREQEAMIAALPVGNGDVMAARFVIRQQLLARAQEVLAMIPLAQVGGIHRESS